MKRYLLAATALLSLGISTDPAHAAPVVYFGNGGAANPTLGASVSFEQVGGQVRIILRNLSLNNDDVGSNQLGAVFFNLPGTLGIATATANVSAGSSIVSTNNCLVLAACTASQANVGGEWAYLDTLNTYGATEGLSSTGLGVFSRANLNGDNLQGNANGTLNGEEFAIMSAANNYADGSNGFEKNAFIQSSVTFMLDINNLPVDALDNVTNITFQFGSALSAPHFNPTDRCLDCTPDPFLVPEPATMAMFGSGMLALGLARRRRRRDV